MGGRGLDIDGLSDVYILMPMYLDLKKNGVTQALIEQAIGRVGRAGKVGHSHLIELCKLNNVDENTTESEYNQMCNDLHTNAADPDNPVHDALIQAFKILGV